MVIEQELSCSENPEPEKLFLTLLRHVIVGAIVFITIAGLAVGLDLIVQYLEILVVSYYIIQGLKIVKEGIFYLDFFLVTIYFIKVTVDFIRKLFRGHSDGTERRKILF